MFQPLPVPIGNARAISAPFQFVTTGEDNLLVTVVNSKVNARVAIQGRRIDDTGTIIPLGYSLVPGADRVAVSEVFPLGVGALVNLTAYATNDSPSIGQTFVIVQLIRGREGGRELLGTLISGYVTTRQALGWPGSPTVSSLETPGFVRSFLSAGQGFGVSPFDVVPFGARWELLAVECLLVTDATVVSRTPRLTIFGDYGPVVKAPSTVSIGASTGMFYIWTAGFGHSGVSSYQFAQDVLPAGLPVTAGNGIIIDTVNFQPGDGWGQMQIYTREWLEVN